MSKTGGKTKKRGPYTVQKDLDGFTQTIQREIANGRDPADACRVILDMDHACAVCGISRNEVKLLRCSLCHLSHYCSKECQKADFKEHKLICLQRRVQCGDYDGELKCSSCKVKFTKDEDYVSCPHCKLTRYCNSECMESNKESHTRTCAAIVKALEAKMKYQSQKMGASNKLPDVNVASPKALLMKGITTTYDLSTGEMEVKKNEEEFSPALLDNYMQVFTCPIVTIFATGKPELKCSLKCMASTATCNTSISPELAAKIGLRKGKAISATGFKSWDINVHIPTTMVTISVPMVDRSGNEVILHIRVAPVINPNASRLLVLGADWSRLLGEVKYTMSPSSGIYMNEKLGYKIIAPWDVPANIKRYKGDMDMTHIVHVVNEKALEDLHDVLLSEDVSFIRDYNPGDNHENLMIKFTDPSTGELLIALTEDLEKQIKTCGKKNLAVMDIRDLEKKVSELLA